MIATTAPMRTMRPEASLQHDVPPLVSLVVALRIRVPTWSQLHDEPGDARGDPWYRASLFRASAERSVRAQHARAPLTTVRLGHTSRSSHQNMATSPFDLRPIVDASPVGLHSLAS